MESLLRFPVIALATKELCSIWRLFLCSLLPGNLRVFATVEHLCGDLLFFDFESSSDALEEIVVLLALRKFGQFRVITGIFRSKLPKVA